MIGDKNKEKKKKNNNLTNRHLNAKLIQKYFPTRSMLNIRQFKMKQFLALLDDMNVAGFK